MACLFTDQHEARGDILHYICYKNHLPLPQKPYTLLLRFTAHRHLYSVGCDSVISHILQVTFVR